MRDAVERLWPELGWIESPELRESVTRTWILAFESSPLAPEDLETIPFTLKVPDCPATFMQHKRCVVHIARDGARAMQEFLGESLDIDLDVVIAGAILADVGKVLEYEKADETIRQRSRPGASAPVYRSSGRTRVRRSGRRVSHHRGTCRRGRHDPPQY